MGNMKHRRHGTSGRPCPWCLFTVAAMDEASSLQPLYTIKPRPTRDGFSLEGPLIPFTLWYGNASHAASYAKWQARCDGNGARIEVLEPEGKDFKTITIEPDTSYLDGLRLSAPKGTK